MKQVKRVYPAIFTPEPIGYSVFVPDLMRGDTICVSQGDTFEEACQMTFEAVGLCIEGLIEMGVEIPEASKPEDIEKTANEFVVPIVFDFGKYVQLTYSKSIKKTLTIPEWLNNLAVEKQVNFSRVLQNALANELGVSLN